MKKKLVIIVAFATICNYFSFAQSVGCAVEEETSEGVHSAERPSGNACASSFAGNLVKYNSQSFYTVTPNNEWTDVDSVPEPVITLKITVHIVLKFPIDPNNSPNPLWNQPDYMYGNCGSIDGVTTGSPDPDDPKIRDFLNLIDINSARRLGFTLPAGGEFPYVFQPRFRFEVTNVYFYYKNEYYPDNTHNQFFSFLLANHRDRIDEGYPILMKPYPGAQGAYVTNGAFIPDLSLPYNERFVSYIVSNVSPTSDIGGIQFNASHLRHELGHALGLWHPYYGGSCYPCKPSSHPESPTSIVPTTPCSNSGDIPVQLNCNDPELLIDLFPINNPLCSLNTYPNPTGCPNPPLNACENCYENDNVATNNFMSDNAVYNPASKRWITPLQIGRMRKHMHLSHRNIRRWAKDMESEHDFVWKIQEDENWNFDIQMYEDIVVETGNTLTISCIVKMARGGRIIVKKGAKLIIDDGFVTGWCEKGLWRGVEIDGDRSIAQAIGANGLDPNHGIVEVINDGTISHAQFGIYAGRTNVLTNAHINNSEGGIVILNNAHMLNNQYDLGFFTFPYNNISTITNSSFLTTDAVGLDVSTSQPLPVKEHIKIWRCQGIKIAGCNFEYTGGGYAPNARGIGIFSTDSKYSVLQGCDNNTNPCTGTLIRTTFKDLHVGVFFNDVNPLSSSEIENADFIDNNYVGLIAHNTAFCQIKNNTFSGDAWGIYMNKSKYYTIRDNDFTGIGNQGIGILAYDSKSGGHNIYGNSFKELFIGINAIDVNGPDGSPNNPINPSDGLIMNCNDFNPNDLNDYDIAVTATSGNITPLIRTNQSPNGITIDNSNTVRNIYGALSWGNENKYYVDPSNTQVIVHHSNSDAVTQPDNPITTQSSSQVMVIVHNNLPLIYSQHCKGANARFGGSASTKAGKLGTLNDFIGVLNEDNEDGKHFGDVQWGVSNKLWLFLSDTAASDADSIYNLFATNQGKMNDADVFKVFALMRAGDHDGALTAVSDLNSSKTDWIEILPRIIYYDEHPEEPLTGEDLSLFESYAVTEGKDGQGCAQAILRVYENMPYELPVAYPAITGSRQQVQQDKFTKLLLSESSRNEKIIIYPNPTNKGLTIENLQGDSEKTVIVKDLLGREILNNFIGKLNSYYISMDNLKSGLYILSIVSQENKILYQRKVSKQE